MLPIQEPKYGIQAGRIFNRASGEFIPDDEPVFILRARDLHAVPTLNYYLQNFGSGDHHSAVEGRLLDFANFRENHPDRMKQPDTDTSSVDGGGFNSSRAMAQIVENMRLKYGDKSATGGDPSAKEDHWLIQLFMRAVGTLMVHGATKEAKALSAEYKKLVAANPPLVKSDK